MSDRTPLTGTDRPPAERYDVALLDLDGVVYLGHEGIPGAAEALAAARRSGMRLAFVTNNASRTPEGVAALLTDVGVAADPGEVVTSAQAACHVLADRLPAGSKLLVVGAEGLVRAAEERGFVVVTSADDDPAAVVQGYGPDVGWRQLAEIAVAVHRGVPWMATNLDPTVPSPRGRLPGNGSLVGTVRVATGVDPMVAGKPDPAMHRESVQRSGAHDPLVVGDRLDTDIEGATRADCASMLVFTGVTRPVELLTAVPAHRPTYLAEGLDGLLVPHPAPVADGNAHTCAGFRAEVTGDALTLTGAGDRLDALRALCAAAWAADLPTTEPPKVRAGDDTAAGTLRDLEIPYNS